MAFLFIEKPIETVIESLQWDIAALEKTAKKHPNEDLFTKINALNDKLRCAELYSVMSSRKGEYDKFKYLKWKNPEEYLLKCREYIANIKGIDFVAKTKRFRVRVSRNGSVKNLGEFDTPQDAIQILALYM